MQCDLLAEIQRGTTNLTYIAKTNERFALIFSAVSVYTVFAYDCIAEDLHNAVEKEKSKDGAATLATVSQFFV